MTSLLEIKQYILRFYMKNEAYIAYVWYKMDHTKITQKEMDQAGEDEIY